jgi:hypothetical protein
MRPLYLTIFTHTHTHTHTYKYILHVGFLNFKREGGKENLIYYWGVTFSVRWDENIKARGNSSETFCSRVSFLLPLALLLC